MKKKIFLSFMLILSLMFLTTGCKKEEKEQGEKKNYYVEINYNTLMDAFDSDEDAFLVYFHDESAEEYEAMSKIIQEFANKNKKTIYHFDLRKYLNDDWEVNKEDYMDGYGDYEATNCISDVIPNEDGEVYIDEDGNEIPVNENEAIAVYTEGYDAESCKLDYQTTIENKIMDKFTEDFRINNYSSLSFIYKGFIRGYFNDFIPEDYYTLDKTEQKKIIESSSADLEKWLDAVFSNKNLSSEENANTEE